MTTQTKTKYFRNPERNKPAETYKPYIPQYKLKGLHPIEGMSAPLAETVPTPKVSAQIIAKQQPTQAQKERVSYPITNNLPYAEVGSPSFQGIMPNVGNNAETSWSGMDAYIIDDLSLNNNDIITSAQMIDNNEWVSPATYTLSDADLTKLANDRRWTEEELQSVSWKPAISIDKKSLIPLENDNAEMIDVFDISQLNIGHDEYILMFRNEILAIGSFENIQQEAKMLILNEHKLSTSDLSVEEVVVLKRIKINVGVFLEKE